MIDENTKLYGYIITSKVRTQILKILLKESPLMQSSIAKKMKSTQQRISKEIYNLEKKGLIECITPDKGSYKAYRITELGKEINQ